MANGNVKVLGWLALAAVVLVAVGIGGLLYWGWGLYAEQAKAELNNNPVIQQYIGNIEEMSLNFGASSDIDDEDTFVFDVKGAKGEGVVTAEFVTIDHETEELRSGTLRLPNGETHDLMQ